MVEFIYIKVSRSGKGVRRSDMSDSVVNHVEAIEMVGHVHNLKGQWGLAEKLFVEVETRKQKLGSDHPDTHWRHHLYLKQYPEEVYINKAEETNEETDAISCNE